VTNNEGEAAPPTLFEHCVRTYRAMLEDATRIEVQPDEEDGPEIRGKEYVIVYEGFFTALITQKLSYSSPYYSSIKNALIRMGCIRQLRRGGSSTPSQWELIWEPTYEAFAKQEDKDKKPNPSKAKDIEGQLRQQVNTLSQRVAALEKWQSDVNSTLVNRFGKEAV
jgi:hypothetical protein